MNIEDVTVFQAGVTREHFDATMIELKALIAQLANRPEQSLTMTTAEVCAQTGHSNYFGLHTWSKKWKLKQVSKGRYLREDVRLALARAAFVAPTPRKKLKIAA